MACGRYWLGHGLYSIGAANIVGDIIETPLDVTEGATLNEDIVCVIRHRPGGFAGKESIKWLYGNSGTDNQIVWLFLLRTNCNEETLLQQVCTLARGKLGHPSCVSEGLKGSIQELISQVYHMAWIQLDPLCVFESAGGVLVSWSWNLSPLCMDSA